MTFIIAEAGVNHGGKFETALKLVDAAKGTGADAVKFQLFDSRKLWGDDRIGHLELSRSQMLDIRAYCSAVGIEFMCTPFGIEEAQFLAPMVQRMKIASGCIGNEALLNAVRDTKLPVILSTGMSTMPDIQAALNHLGHTPLFYEGAQRNITLLHCTSSYPCRLEDVNLKAMETLRRRWGHFSDPLLPSTGFICDIGYSDHTSGITVPIAAVALGATVIEKHLTLDRNLPGPDHKASITPREFKGMVMAIREVEAALGDGGKRVMPSEEALRKVWRERS